MGDIGMIKGGACLVTQTRRRVIGDVVDHSGINSGLRVYQREEGEETINTEQTSAKLCMTRQKAALRMF